MCYLVHRHPVGTGQHGAIVERSLRISAQVRLASERAVLYFPLAPHTCARATRRWHWLAARPVRVRHVARNTEVHTWHLLC
jgi:hypothetical protein